MESSKSRFPNVCPYVLRNKRVCGRPCIKSMCFIHSDKKGFTKCLTQNCDKLTNSKIQFCTACGVTWREEQRKAERRLKKETKEHEHIQAIFNLSQAERGNKLARLEVDRINFKAKLAEIEAEIKHTKEKIKQKEEEFEKQRLEEEERLEDEAKEFEEDIDLP